MKARRWLVGVVAGAAACLQLLDPTSAAAHTELVESDPAADQVVAVMPIRVSLRFSEEVSPDLAAVSIRTSVDGPTMAEVAAGGTPTTISADLPALLADSGRVDVTYRVTSVDGHPINGTLRFRVEPAKERGSESGPVADDEKSTRGPGASPGEAADPEVSEDSNPWVAPLLGLGLLIPLGVVILLARQSRRSS